jgi:hypothetical protein
MNEDATCTDCGRPLCAHGYCPECEPGFCTECTMAHAGKHGEDHEIGGES